MTPLFGGAFEFADARAYLQAYDDCFVKQVSDSEELQNSPSSSTPTPISV